MVSGYLLHGFAKVGAVLIRVLRHVRPPTVIVGAHIISQRVEISMDSIWDLELHQHTWGGEEMMDGGNARSAPCWLRRLQTCQTGD